MKITILPRLTAVLVGSFTIAAAGTEGSGDHGLRPKFDPAACEEWLREHDPDLRANLLGGFGDFPLLGIGARRVAVAVPPLIDLAAYDEGFVWFTAPPHARARDIEPRLAAARAGRNDLPERPAVDPAPFDFAAPASAFEREALGLEIDGPVPLASLRGQAFATTDGWRIQWRLRGRLVGRLELRNRDARIGYTNAVYEWQWESLSNQRLAGRSDLRWPTIPKFVENNGHALWLRAAGERRFGYALRVYEELPGRWTYEFAVYKVLPTPRLASSPADVVFPGAYDPPFGAPRPQMMNLRIIDVGLRLRLDPNPTNE